MSTYICEKCGCVDNTACGGNYWSVAMMKNSKKIDPMFEDDYSNKHKLCCECTPPKFIDGSINNEAGKQHNRFPKRHWSECGDKENIIERCNEKVGNFVNAIEYFQNLK